MSLSNTFWNSPEIIQQEEAEVNALISRFWSKNVDSIFNTCSIPNPVVQETEQKFNEELLSKFWHKALTQ